MATANRGVRLLGWVLIFLGVLFNEWVLTRLLSPDGVVMPLKRSLIWAFDLVCVGLGSVLVTSRRRSGHFGKAIVLTVFVALFSLFLLESGLRLYFAFRARMFSGGRVTADLLGWQTNPSFQSAGEVPGYGFVRYSTTNHGFRAIGDVSAGHRKILVLGDSTTEALQVSDGLAYYDYLERHCSDVEIFAYGTGGYGSLQEYLILNAHWDWIRPDLVLWQFDGNDIMNNSLALESASESSVRMIRPYLAKGRIELRYPSRCRSSVLRALESSCLVRLLGVMPNLMEREHQAHGEIDGLSGRGAEFAEACSTTREIMELVRERLAATPLVAFCIYEGKDRELGRVYEKICASLGFHYVAGVDAAIEDAKHAGLVVTGVEDGRQIDTHLNARGHALVGRILADYLMEAGLMDCQPAARLMDAPLRHGTRGDGCIDGEGE
ncbi:MAG: SGNH/GDSL hydrolase family protein [Kiritimatiellae bacterium]|nr:SGNH/GDSL hydrolase family protein [Kiritimatiellia bacterium]